MTPIDEVDDPLDFLLWTLALLALAAADGVLIGALLAVLMVRR